MTTDELLTILARDYPNGVSFEPMAVRLLRHKGPFSDSQIEKLKAEMLQMSSKLWVSLEMISDKTSQLALFELATEWLEEYGCFSVEQLFRKISGTFRLISTLEDRVTFLRHLDFTVAAWGEKGHFCFQAKTTLGDCLAAISESIASWLDEAGGSLTFHEIEQELPQLTAEELESIRGHFLPEVHKVEVGGVTCWRTFGAISLPENFSEELTIIVDKLLFLGEKPSVSNLQLALSLHYNTRFREEFHLTENSTFMRICEKHYQGGNNAFQKPLKNIRNTSLLPRSGKRVRGPNSTFQSIGIPIGAKLTYTKNSQVFCVVLNNLNQVEYSGRAWAISALAMHLLGGKPINGFCLFSFEGETLWDRRLRLEQKGKSAKCQTTVVAKPLEGRVKGSAIIGLEGRELAPATWRVFKCAGKNPRVAEWAQRVENGESAEIIAIENGLKVETVKAYINHRRGYLLVCEKNGIVPEGDSDV